MKKAFVVGHPIAHSRSPLIHRSWLNAYGIEGSYERIDVAPGDFAEFLSSFAERGYVGGNVTLPHKEAAFAKAARRTTRAERVGAANTLWLEDGRLVADNTDVEGFMAHLDQSVGADWHEGVTTALVIGAGGAARAALTGLLDRPLENILLVNRTMSRAQDLVQGFDDARLTALPWERMSDAVSRSGLIVNTTSLGMKGQPPLDIDLSPAAQAAIVADIVYVPLETPFLKAAKARGLRGVDGLGMLLHQAAPGFQRWFGLRPIVTPELHALIAADIAGTS